MTDKQAEVFPDHHKWWHRTEQQKGLYVMTRNAWEAGRAALRAELEAAEPEPAVTHDEWWGRVGRAESEIGWTELRSPRGLAYNASQAAWYAALASRPPGVAVDPADVDEALDRWWTAVSAGRERGALVEFGGNASGQSGSEAGPPGDLRQAPRGGCPGKDVRAVPALGRAPLGRPGPVPQAQNRTLSRRHSGG